MRIILILIVVISFQITVHAQSSLKRNGHFTGIWKNTVTDTGLCKSSLFYLQDSSITLKILRLTRFRLDDPKDGIYKLLSRWNGDTLMVSFYYNEWMPFALILENKLWIICQKQNYMLTPVKKEDLSTEEKKLLEPRALYHYRQKPPPKIKPAKKKTAQ